MKKKKRKKVGEVAVSSIMAERKRGKFKSLLDFCARLDSRKITHRTLENLIKCGAFDSLDKRRTAMLAAIDKAMSAGWRQQQDQNGGAISLFTDDEVHDQFVLPNVKESSPQEILAWEKATLGLYLSGHPLDTYREIIHRLTSSNQIANKIGKRVKVGGTVSEIRQILTRKGDSMAFATLEDFDGTVDIVVFPEIFAEALKKNFLQRGEVVIAAGRVDRTKDVLQVVAESVTAAAEYAPDFWLTIPAQIDNPATLDKLKQLLKVHAGWSSVYLNRNGIWSKITKKFSDSEKLRDELKNLLGEENIRLY